MSYDGLHCRRVARGGKGCVGCRRVAQGCDLGLLRVPQGDSGSPRVTRRPQVELG